MRKFFIIFFAVLLLAIVPLASVSAQQQQYVVQYGDTLFRIAVRFNTSIQALATANGIANPNFIYVGQVLTIPTGGTPPPATPGPTAPPTGETTYVVQRGDFLSAIARRFNVTTTAIITRNSIANPNLIYPGQQLIIPGGTGAPPPTAVPPTGVPPTAPPGGTTTYRVAPGDTLARIAARFGTTTSAIAAANGISNPNLIYVGQLLTIPSGSGPVPTPVPGATATTRPPTNPPPGGVSFELGGQIVTGNFGLAPQMRQAGMTWVKLQVRHNQGDSPSVAQGAIDGARANGFRVLLSVIGNPSQLAANTGGYIADFANFLGGVAALGPDAIEVWNEQNIDREWPRGLISPTTYTQMLQASFNSIKSRNSAVLVVSGAPAPTGFFGGGCTGNGCDDDAFIRGMAAAGAGNYADCIGIHYNEGVVPPTASSGDPRGNPNHYTRYFPTMVNLYASVFPNKQLCFTELGYLTAEGLGPLPPAFGWAATTSLQEQAEWLAQAAVLSRNTGRVRMLIVFNIDATRYDDDPQAGFAIVRGGNTCIACNTLGGVMGN
ncbi:MAG: LysM peptidoglycan-binding domain-containing protein [Pleurocapsa minor GSE-CHR-MK-17-07R]|jgi:LysM repeat protein|nr:LysM peptidoglycan-binding domain-containing protein [Pleurocapsa minor GSE-CHR-MK 17-07R]